MNIAVFSKRTTFHKGFGGLETQNKALCEGLVKQGHQITVFTPKFEIKLDSAEEKGVKYIFVPCEYRYLYSSSKNSWVNKSATYFEKFHNETKFDLVLAQSSSGIGIVKRKAELGVKVISIAHGTIISELRTRFKNVDSLYSLLMLIPDTGYAIVNFFSWQRVFVHGSDKVISVSSYVKSALIDETYAPEDKFEVIHNGLDIQNFLNKIGGSTQDDSNDTNPEEVRLLFVGRLVKEKGVDLLIKIFSEADFKDVYLDVIGGGPLEEKLKKRVKMLNLENRIIFHGKKSPDEVIAHYGSKKTKIFLFPTKRYEGFPMVLVEAMLSGLPVVAFNMGGVKDAVRDNETGYLIPEGENSYFKDRVLELINDADKRREFGLNAYKIASDEFSLDAMINKYQKVINEV